MKGVVTIGFMAIIAGVDDAFDKVGRKIPGSYLHDMSRKRQSRILPFGQARQWLDGMMKSQRGHGRTRWTAAVQRVFSNLSTRTEWTTAEGNGQQAQRIIPDRDILDRHWRETFGPVNAALPPDSVVVRPTLLPQVAVSQIFADPDLLPENSNTVDYLNGLMELARDMKAHGQRDPILITNTPEGYRAKSGGLPMYLAQGFRRVAAARLAGLEYLTANFLPDMTETEVSQARQNSYFVRRTTNA